jgi:adenosylcobinamide-phosphate guanylyltransferase
MRIVALIMAGGRGKRLVGDIEKPMVRLLGKPLIRRVIEATKESKRISETYVAVTLYSSKTAKEAAEASAKVVETKGLGYHADLREAVLTLNLTCPILTISSDLPLVNGKFLDGIIEKYEESHKPALTVLIPIRNCRKYGIEPTSFYEHKGNSYAVSGINMIDGQRILEEQEQEVIICRKPQAVFNINTPEDLESAKNYLLRIEKS